MIEVTLTIPTEGPALIAGAVLLYLLIGLFFGRRHYRWAKLNYERYPKTDAVLYWTFWPVVAFALALSFLITVGNKPKE